MPRKKKALPSEVDDTNAEEIEQESNSNIPAHVLAAAKEEAETREKYLKELEEAATSNKEEENEETIDDGPDDDTQADDDVVESKETTDDDPAPEVKEEDKEKKEKTLGKKDTHLEEINILKAAIAKQDALTQSLVDQNKALMEMVSAKQPVKEEPETSKVNIDDLKKSLDTEIYEGFSEKASTLIASMIEARIAPVMDSMKGIKNNFAVSKQQQFENALAAINFKETVEDPKFQEFIGLQKQGILYRSLYDALQRHDMSSVQDIVRAYQSIHNAAATAIDDDKESKEDTKGKGKEPVYGDKKANVVKTGTRDVTDDDIKAAQRRYEMADRDTQPERYKEWTALVKRQTAQQLAKLGRDK